VDGQGWRRNKGREETVPTGGEGKGKRKRRRERRMVVGEGEIKYSIIEME
jgi:hypothetical protein